MVHITKQMVNAVEINILFREKKRRILLCEVSKLRFPEIFSILSTCIRKSLFNLFQHN
ncbi:hypothetical protein HanXRQr2_Chr10g0461931 [Helianthus annuus]|uniref:Uncharacterized protein n=1 Tax=Helianthus annuus TaxID=4232 RepID=A0A9K3I1G3_HELAN|nr:hypothetical protein HanXRQr2_Chr10g0461931 [Helianthus annuus]KAJ0885493.1 hypothetical protein HanPSC8_Chr10g0445831 [Helianthus annuus]